jgi:hypothetical protein
MAGLKRPRQKMTPIGIVLLVLGGGLTGYWAWTYTGIYRWLAELQLKMMHSYEVQITFILTLTIVLGPLFLISEVIRRSTAAPTGQSTGVADKPNESDTPPNRIMIALTAGGTVGLVGLGFVAVGGYQYRQGMTAGNIFHADVSAYETGQAPARLYVSVTGQSLRDATEILKDSDSATKYFMPLVSADWDPGKPIGLFLETSSPNMMASNALQRAQPDGNARSEVWEGMIDTTGLPGLVRTHFENEHAIFAAGYRVLSVGETPQKQMDKARVLIYIGGGVFIFGMLMGCAVSWQNRKLAAAKATIGTQQRQDPRLQIKSVIDFQRKDQP